MRMVGSTVWRIFCLAILMNMYVFVFLLTAVVQLNWLVFWLGGGCCNFSGGVCCNFLGGGGAVIFFGHPLPIESRICCGPLLMVDGGVLVVCRWVCGMCGPIFVP